MDVVISVGGRFHAVQLAEQLYRLGHLRKIITTKSWYVQKLFPSRYYSSLPLPEYLGMIIRKIPALRRKGYYSYLKDNLFDASARKYIPPCDVFHAWGNYALYSIPTVRRFGAKVVIERGSTHPYYQDEILKEEYERFGVRSERAHPQIIEKGLKEIELADKVIIPSEFVQRSFLSHGVSGDKLAMIPYGIDLTSFKQVPKKDSKFRVLFVGNIGIQKGVHYLLEAWKSLALVDAELVLIGTVEEEMKPVLRQYEGSFIYRGHVNHEELFNEYSQASVFVLPSLQEGSALVTYEAMACGLPLIVSENTGSIIRDGNEGFVTAIRDIDALKERLAWCYSHPDEARQMGLRGSESVRNYTWERYANSVVEVYETLLR